VFFDISTKKKINQYINFFKVSQLKDENEFPTGLQHFLSENDQFKLANAKLKICAFAKREGNHHPENTKNTKALDVFRFAFASLNWSF
jgi:hypothetical protein